METAASAMHRIALEDLSPRELHVLQFNIDIIYKTDEEKQFIYDNLFRDENGLAYYPSKNRKNLLTLYTD